MSDDSCNWAPIGLNLRSPRARHTARREGVRCRVRRRLSASRLARRRARGTSPRAATNPAPSPGSKRRRVSLPDERPDLEVPKRLTNRPSAAAEESDAIAMDAANIPVVSASEFHARLAAAAHPKALDAYAAFYSSWYAPAREATRPRSTPARTALPSPFSLRSRASPLDPISATAGPIA